ncbi:uncharacterized protein EDB91DRAFT_1256622 [Suillus paluster]|uniref:uncharacterized protein n=1 Tax=Suillus paluster TaxID=48578 RepID=UPI001B8836E1|nr:uncharacterized protein EDB91DRAFT_1256622 [Suillus paluster]KAG1721201.1 hypothetical protein EDB91DRAFT_1256622 [Suillus paluster]
MDGLEAPQLEALQRLQSILGPHDTEFVVSVLESVAWDVQKATDLLFDNEPPRVVEPPIQTTPMAQFEFHDIDEDSSPAIRPSQRGQGNQRSNWSFIWSILAVPLHLVSGVLRFVFGVLRIPIPSLPFMTTNSYHSHRSVSSDSRSITQRWVQELEEETGACSSKRSMANAVTTGFEAGPSTTRRHTYPPAASDDSQKVLPDFFDGSYEDVLDICQREGRIACVVIVSAEHDDDAEFKRSTLTDASFVKLLLDNNFIVWGGDVREKAAWDASQKLQATTYPFVAFLALQPRRHGASSNSSPVVTILSRHQGRAATTAPILIEHLNTQLLPRVTPFLVRFKTALQDRDRDRRIREEQDRAFREATRRDREAIEARIRQEKEEEERARRLAEDVKRKQEDSARQKHQAGIRMEWRKFMRKSLLVPEARGLRLAIKLPGNGRVVRSFPPSATLTSLYAFADSQLIPPTSRPEDDPSQAPEGVVGDIPQLDSYILSQTAGHAWWGFTLASAYPRREFRWKANTSLTEIGLRDGEQIVMELITAHVSTNGQVSDDEYESESE